MGVFFSSTEITGIKNLFPSIAKDITELYFGDLELFTVWGTYEGTLPAQFNANGDNLKVYKVWGNTGGVGKETVNLFDGQWLQGYYAQSGGAYHEADTWICFKNKIPCKPNTAYTLKYFANSRYYSIGWYNEDDAYISMNTSTVSGEGVAVLTATSPANAAYLACSVAGYPSSSSRIAPEDAANTVLIEGSTAPSTYIPYGHEVDVETVDGTKNLFNKNDTPTVGYLIANSAINEDSKWRVSGYIPITSEKTYVISNVAGNSPQYRLYDINKNDIGGNMYSNRSTIQLSNLSSNVAFIRLSVAISTTAPNLDTLMLTEGSTAPESYIPYTSTTTPVYIGTSALEKDEYIDSESGKVYRRTEQLWDGVWLQGGINTSTGEIDDRTTYVHTNPIPCQDINKMLFKYFGVAHDGVVKIIYRGTYGDEWVFARWQDSGNDFEGFSLDVSYAKSLIFSFSAAESGEDISPETAEQLLLMDTDEAPTAETAYVPYLQPTDPPSPLPQLPTIDGPTIIEVDSTIQPEKVSLTYRKEGFE